MASSLLPSAVFLAVPAFVGFNAAWLGIWAASVPGLRSGHHAARFAAWFLAVAGARNGLGHPAFARLAGGYFPGLFPSPVVAAAAVSLGLRLGTARTPGRVRGRRRRGLAQSPVCGSIGAWTSPPSTARRHSSPARPAASAAPAQSPSPAAAPTS